MTGDNKPKAKGIFSRPQILVSHSKASATLNRAAIFSQGMFLLSVY